MDDDLPDLPHYRPRDSKNQTKQIEAEELSDSDDDIRDFLKKKKATGEHQKKESVQQTEVEEFSQLEELEIKSCQPTKTASSTKVLPVSISDSVQKKYDPNEMSPSKTLTKDDRQSTSRRNTIFGSSNEPEYKARFLNPNSKFRARWDILMVVMLLYTSILVPYEIAFLGQGTSIDGLFVWNRVVDLTFFIDMIFNFMTPFQDKESGQLCYDKSAIVSHYFRGWFPLDFVSILPFDVVGLLVNNSAVGQLKILRVIRLLRLMKLARVFRASRIFSRWESTLGLTYAVIKLVKFILGVMMLGHWLACMWGLAPTLVEVPEGDTNWLRHYSFEDEGPGVTYIASLYWAVMTLTTIGYGDLVPQNSQERFVCIMAMMIGGGVYAYIVGAVCGIVASMDEATTEFNQQMDHLNVYMERVNAPKRLRILLRDYFLHSKDLLQHKYWSKVINHLSPGLRGAFAVHTNGSWTRKIPFFTGGPNDEDVRFVTAITQKIKAELFPPQEAIIHVGDPTNKMYIVSKGLVARLGKVMGKGNFFGEDVILAHGTRHYSVLTLTYVDAYSLSREDLADVLSHDGFPNKQKKIKRAAVYLALQRRLQHLYSELRMLRSLANHSAEFERNWLRLRLLGKNAKTTSSSTLGDALTFIDRTNEAIEKAIEKDPNMPGQDSIEATRCLLKTASQLLEATMNKLK